MGSTRGQTSATPVHCLPDISAVRTTPGMAFERGAVAGLLDESSPVDLLFARAFAEGLGTLTSAAERSAVANVTGHVAESLVESVLVDAGLIPVWHFVKAGVGVDLVMLTPNLDQLVAIEVKGTLRSHHWPRLSRRPPGQFTPDWLDRVGNVGMAAYGLAAEDVVGVVTLVNFTELEMRLGASPTLDTYVAHGSAAALVGAIGDGTKDRR